MKESCGSIKDYTRSLQQSEANWKLKYGLTSWHIVQKVILNSLAGRCKIGILCKSEINARCFPRLLQPFEVTCLAKIVTIIAQRFSSIECNHQGR